MRKLINRFMHIRQRSVALLFFKAVVNLWLPAFGQFLQGADIQVAVVKPSLQFWQVLEQKPSVLPNGVTAHGGHTFADIFLHELNQLLFCLGFGCGRGLDLIDQATFAMRALVPSVHAGQQLIALVNHHHRAFNARREIRACDNDGNFK